jgi:hypothetical protein
MNATLDLLRQYPAIAVSIMSAFVSVAALTISGLNFYYVNFRRGKLIVSSPRVFEIAEFPETEQNYSRVVLRLPFVFFNRGALPRTVQSLQLAFLDKVKGQIPHNYKFWATVKHFTTRDIEAGTMLQIDQERRLAYQFPVKAREALPYICEFWSQPGETLLGEQGSKRVELRAKVDNKDEWETLVTFSLHLTKAQADIYKAARGKQVFVAFTNNAEDEDILPEKKGKQLGQYATGPAKERGGE